MTVLLDIAPTAGVFGLTAVLVLIDRARPARKPWRR